MNVWWFLLSQTFYGIGSFAVMSMLFQLKFRKHGLIVLIISVLSSVINYLVYFNKGADIGYIVPLITVLTMFLYLSAVAKVPAMWALVVTATGGVALPTIIGIGIMLGSLGYFAPSELKLHIWKNYALDIISGLIFSIVATVLYLRGWGFRFDFEKIRFKWERFIVIIISTCASIVIPTAIMLSHMNDITLNLTYLSLSTFLAFLLLLGYALKKEKDENEFLKPPTKEEEER
ncbi:hypothetical protein ACU3L3_07155 [Priestia endophytica]